jgi:hypothetical protein
LTDTQGGQNPEVPWCAKTLDAVDSSSRNAKGSGFVNSRISHIPMTWLRSGDHGGSLGRQRHLALGGLVITSERHRIVTMINLVETIEVHSS